MADAGKGRRRTCAGVPRVRAVVAAASLLVIGLSPLAAAQSGDLLAQGKRNGTTAKETEIIGDINTTARDKGGFVMRMSNLSKTGGGFVNGCRASAAPTSKPCYRASNLSTGRAFEFNTNDGRVVGTISAGAGGPTRRPFTTNATGTATGLNADRVDDLHAAQIIAAARAQAGLDADTLDGKDSAAFLGRTEQAADADRLDGRDAASFASSTQAVKAGFVFDDGAVTHVTNTINGGAFSVVSDLDGVDTIDLPFPIAGLRGIVSAGVADNAGGQTDVCVHQLRHVDADTISVHSMTVGNVACNEEWTLLLF